MTLLDGKALSQKLIDQMRSKVSAYKNPPGLTVILVGDDPASAVYVRNKHQACEKVGIRSNIIKLPAAIQKQELIQTIEKLNADPAVHGILIQLPLPKHLPSEEVLSFVSEQKDVDGFHHLNAGKFFRGQKALMPCTPKGVIRLLEEYKVEMSGKTAVVLGRSNVVGKPMAMMLLEKNATVTVCHGQTKDPKFYCQQADIIVSAVGKAGLIQKDWVKNGACVVDVGMNRNLERKLVGDVAFEEVSSKTSFITPVPGGVGPMTIAMLLENTIQAFENQR